MRRTNWIALGLAAAAVAIVPAAEAAAPPEVSAVVASRDAATGNTTLQVVGRKLNAFKTFGIDDAGGPTGAVVTQLLKGKVSITLRLDRVLVPGDYTLRLVPKTGDPTSVPFSTIPGPGDLDLAALPRISASSDVGDGVTGTTSALLQAGVRGIHDAVDAFGYGVLGELRSGSGAAVYGRSTSTGAGGAVGVLGDTEGTTGSGVRGRAGSATGNAVGVFAFSDAVDGAGLIANMSSNGGANSVALQVDHSGTVGNIARFQRQGLTFIRFDMNGVGYFNGGTQTGGADFAESVTVNAPKREFEPGDVLVIDPDGERRFALSRVADSPLVAGIYSTKPGVLARPGQVADDAKWASTEVPLAITGIVPCKVCDEGGPVRAGDLLVAASIPGHAKRAPAVPAPGTLLGKALGRLDGRRGKVEVLITMR